MTEEQTICKLRGLPIFCAGREKYFKNSSVSYGNGLYGNGLILNYPYSVLFDNKFGAVIIKGKYSIDSVDSNVPIYMLKLAAKFTDNTTGLGLVRCIHSNIPELKGKQYGDEYQIDELLSIIESLPDDTEYSTAW